MASPRRFSNTRLNEEDLNAALTSTARSLDLSGADLSQLDSAQFLVDALWSNTNVKEFEHANLNTTRLGLDGLDTLVCVLLEMPLLETFQIRGCGLTKESGFYFSKLLVKQGMALQALDVRENRLGDMGVAALAGAFSTDISYLPLPVTNSSISNSISSSISILTLKTLDLSNNELGDMSVLALCRGLTQLAKHAGAAGRKPSLTSLLLNGNMLGDKSAFCLAQLLCLTETTSANGSSTGSGKLAAISLEELSLNDNNISSRGMAALLNPPLDKNLPWPLKILGIGRCHPSLDVLPLLATALLSDRCCLESVALHFPEVEAEAAMQAARANALSVSSGKPSSALSLSECMSGLATACVKASCRSDSGTAGRRISVNLGHLPQAMQSACINAEETSGDDGGAMFMDLYAGLETLFTASQFIVLPPAVHAWILTEIQPQMASPPSAVIAATTPTPAPAPPSSPQRASENGAQSSPAPPVPKPPLEDASSSLSNSNGAPTQTSLPFPGLQLTPLTSHAPDAVRQQQQQYESIRREHSLAFSALASEIKRMAESPRNGTGTGFDALEEAATPKTALASTQSTPFSFGIKETPDNSASSTPMTTSNTPTPSPRQRRVSFGADVASSSDTAISFAPSPAPAPAPGPGPTQPQAPGEAPFTPRQLDCIQAMVSQVLSQAEQSWRQVVEDERAQTQRRMDFLIERFQHLEVQLLTQAPPSEPSSAAPALAELLELGRRVDRLEKSIQMQIHQQQQQRSQRPQSEYGHAENNNVLSVLTLAKRVDRVEERGRREEDVSRALASLSDRLSQLEEVVEEDQTSSLALYDALLHSNKKPPAVVVAPKEPATPQRENQPAPAPAPAQRSSNTIANLVPHASPARFPPPPLPLRSPLTSASRSTARTNPSHRR